MKPEARPKPKEARTEEEAKQEEPNKREAEEGGYDKKSPIKMVVLTKQVGNRGREKKAGYIEGAMDEIRKKGTTDKTSEKEEDWKETKEEERHWKHVAAMKRRRTNKILRRLIRRRRQR